MQANRQISDGCPRRYYLILFLVSLSMLSAEVTVTRLLSYKFFLHFVYLVISLAHLGIAGAGAWIFAERLRAFTPAFYRRALCGMALALLLFLGAYVWLAPYPPDGLMKVEGTRAIPYLVLLSLLLVAFYFAVGCVLAAAFTQYQSRFNRLYAADLVGASAGCVASLGLMALLGPVQTLLVSGFLAACAAALLGDGRRARRQAASSAAMLAAVGVLLLTAWGGTRLLERQAFRAKNLDGTPVPASAEYRWTHLARVDRLAPSHYVIDGDAATLLDNPEWESEVEFLVAPPQARVAIIGVGAGPQLREALRHRPESVLAVDINATIVDWSRGPDSGFNQGIFNRPDVTVLVDEGRHAIRSHPGQFDVLVMHAIDTFAASSMGAYSLTENYLYTVEAFRDFYAKLSPDGLMGIRRWQFYPPRENLRLFTTIFAALAEAGVEHPEQHLIVLSPTRDWKNPELRVMGLLMFSKQPWGAERLAVVDRFVADHEWSYLFRPGERVDSAFSDFVASPDREKFYREYPYFVKPCYDSNPFFFQFTHPLAFLRQGPGADGATLPSQSTNTLFVTLLLLTVLCVIMLGWPVARSRWRARVGRPSAAVTTYFAGLGLGFMAVELAGIQVMTLFLGHPTYALTVILLGILAFAGLGSALARYIPRRAAPGVCLLLAILAALAALGLLPLVHGLIALPFWLRVAITLGLLLLLGVPLGMPMALGVREIGADNQLQVAWAWACNGAAGVLGTNACMIVMIYCGMPAVLWIGAGCYFLASFLLPRIATPAPAGATLAEPAEPRAAEHAAPGVWSEQGAAAPV
jgi:predicted membrane-bound spermidine synthase